MMLSVNLIDSIPKNKFQERIDKFINPTDSYTTHYKILPLTQVGLMISFYDNSVTFNIYKKAEKQKEVIQTCIKEIFQDDDIVYRCDEECNWLDELENDNIIRIY